MQPWSPGLPHLTAILLQCHLCIANARVRVSRVYQWQVVCALEFCPRDHYATVEVGCLSYQQLAGFTCTSTIQSCAVNRHQSADICRCHYALRATIKHGPILAWHAYTLYRYNVRSSAPVIFNLHNWLPLLHNAACVWLTSPAVSSKLQHS